MIPLHFVPVVVIIYINISTVCILLIIKTVLIFAYLLVLGTVGGTAHWSRCIIRTSPRWGMKNA